MPFVNDEEGRDAIPQARAPRLRARRRRARRRAGPASAATPPELDWKPCGDRFQCADLEVPLDYSRPWWRTIEIPVIKLPATDPERRIGAGIGGAGGPGRVGRRHLRSVGPTLFAPLNERFDLVAFDQRGVGMIDCGPTPDADPGWAEPHDVDAGLIAGRAREIGRMCLERNPLLLPYVTTGNAARDIDRLRVALGEKKLTYLGGSVRHGARRHLFEPVPGPGARDGARRAGGHRRVDGLGRWRGRVSRRRASRTCSTASHVTAQSSPACGFGGDDPEAAIDVLVAATGPRPAAVGRTPGETVDGDLVLLVLAD